MVQGPSTYRARPNVTDHIGCIGLRAAEKRGAPAQEALQKLHSIALASGRAIVTQCMTDPLCAFSEVLCCGSLSYNWKCGVVKAALGFNQSGHSPNSTCVAWLHWTLPGCGEGPIAMLATVQPPPPPLTHYHPTAERK